jgi:hypothetical protein
MGRSAYRLAVAFAAAGHPTNLLTYDRRTDLLTPPYTKADYLPECDVQVLRVGPIAAKRTGALSETKATLTRQFVAQALRSLQAEEKLPDVVLFLGLIDAGFIGLCVAQALGKPHVVSARRRRRHRDIPGR